MAGRPSGPRCEASVWDGKEPPLPELGWPHHTCVTAPGPRRSTGPRCKWVHDDTTRRYSAVACSSTPSITQVR